jgi:RNA polymerase sigma-70 factor (ECF subfamily)
MSGSAPGDILRASWPDEAPLKRWTGLDAWLEVQLVEAETQRPSVGFRRNAVLSALASAIARHQPESLQRLYGVDLLLAAACGVGDEAAIVQLDTQLKNEVARAVRPISPTLVDDVAQQVREKLLVGQPGRIADYAGDGPLGAWLRAVAVRVALNAKRPGAREEMVSSAPEPEQPLADPDPELALLRARYRDSFRVAFAQAITVLSPRERTVLRLSTLDGLTLARIGSMYRKDASTISRWLEQARRTLLTTTREKLGEQLGAQSSELDSLMRIADSELTVSLARLLSSTQPEKSG